MAGKKKNNKKKSTTKNIKKQEIIETKKIENKKIETKVENKSKKEKTKKDKKKVDDLTSGTTMEKELKKVTWPTGEELVKSTSAVIFIVIVVALIIFIADLIFGTLTKKYSGYIQNRNKIKHETNQEVQKEHKGNDEKKK